jgi:hypothetical protein
MFSHLGDAKYMAVITYMYLGRPSGPSLVMGGTRNFVDSKSSGGISKDMMSFREDKGESFPSLTSSCL